jgi:hypothetical protein
MDDEEARLEFHTGGMDVVEAYDRGLVDELGCEYPARSPVPIKAKRRKSMKQLTDQDKMPWGKYQDAKMEDVPASYFHWLWTKEDGLRTKTDCNPVADYIKRNMAALMKEFPNGIWD